MVPSRNVVPLNASIHGIQLHGRPDGLYDGNGNGGGGDMSDLTHRVTRVEDDLKELRLDVKSIKTDLSDIKVSLARIDAKLDAKVDYKWLTIYVLGIVAVVLRSEIIAFFTKS
jgi:hypothetical protein